MTYFLQQLVGTNLLDQTKTLTLVGKASFCSLPIYVQHCSALPC
jgi:hypothetical protein